MGLVMPGLFPQGGKEDDPKDNYEDLDAREGVNANPKGSKRVETTSSAAVNHRATTQICR